MMKSLRFAALVVVVLLGRQVSAQRPGQSTDWWARSTLFLSKYYRVRTDLPKEDALALAQHMDGAFECYMGLFTRLPLRLKRPARLDLYLFADQEDYLQVLRIRFQNDGTGSWGKCITFGNSISLVGWRGGRPAEDMKPLLQHEGLHQVMNHFFTNIPTWLDEGLAELFERGVMVGGKLALGEYSERDKARLLAAIQSNAIMPFHQFLAIDSGAWSAMVRRGDASSQYLQAWSIVHFFLFTENGKYERNFLTFLVQLNRGVDWKAAFVNSFGTPDFRLIEKKWQDHVRHYPLTDYRQTARRVDFLAAGMAELNKRDIYPTSLQELKAELEKAEFKHTCAMFGENRLMDAAVSDEFTIPHATGGGKQEFVLVDSRGRLPKDNPPRRVRTPLNIVTAGMVPQGLGVKWVREGGKYQYLFVLATPKPVGKTTTRPKPQTRDGHGEPNTTACADDERPKTKWSDFRTWTSAGGDYSTDARLIAYVNGVAQLERRDGKLVKVPRERLSPADQRFVDEYDRDRKRR